MTDVVCGTECADPGTPARMYCGNTTSAPSGHLLLEEKALAVIRHFPNHTDKAGPLRKRLHLRAKSRLRRLRSETRLRAQPSEMI